jgi:NAD(P)-dependent dehydrogenase (short-subunit alcohol dehydrogenase family)
VIGPTWTDVAFDCAGRHVLVTGGTSGIGAAIAAAYRAAGASVTITGTRESAKDYDSDLGDCRYLQMTASDSAQLDRLPTRFSTLDVLVNNAGAVWPGGRSEYEPDVFEEALRINLSSAYRLAHACRPLLARSAVPTGGCIIGIASMASYFGIEAVPGYGAAKAGLVQLTKTLAVAWAGDRIRVNAVAAGLTETRMTAGHVSDPQALALTLARTPLRRVGRPSDIAAAALFLTSEAAAFITGQTLPVDGGYSIA